MDRALLVGINAYPTAPLKGCVNDVLDVAAALHQYGFDDSEIRIITDARATKQRIVAELERLVQGAKPGDRIFFWYSGHGSQVPTYSPALELDGLDECICPVDFDFTDATTITDKELHRIFSAVPAGVQAIWASDSCHSGDLERDMQKFASKAYPMPEDITWTVQASRRKKLKHARLGSRSADRLNVAFVSGCRSDQTSADANFAGRANGAFTYFFLKHLREEPQATLRQLVAHVRTSIQAEGFTQRPELVGPPAIIDRPFFS